MASDAISGVTGDIDGQIDQIMDDINGDINIYTDPDHYVSSTRSVAAPIQSSQEVPVSPQAISTPENTTVSSSALSGAYK